jgi:hypothetical protein
MSKPAEYDCTDCGYHIFVFGMAAPPADQRCSVCRWLLHEIDDPIEREAIRKRLRNTGE